MRELSLNVLDLAQNSISAGAKLVFVTVDESRKNDRLSITIEDNGRGMSQEQVLQVSDPFYTTRTTRKVGLGIPLFRMEAEMTGGNFSISSKEGEGTRVLAVFVPSHMDMIPLGDINATMLLLITCNPALDFRFTRVVGEKSFVLDTRELRDTLGEVPFSEPDVARWLREYLEENTAEMKEDNKDEVVS